MEKESNLQGDNNCGSSLMCLPMEILFYIISYLPTRDKIKMRYVCQKFHQLSKTPLLWKKFVWSDWEPRHVCSVSNILKECGEHVREVIFPAHVISTKILEIMQCCSRVTHLSLPTGSQLKLKHLEEILRMLIHLQSLDVYASGIYIKNLFKVTTCANVQELKLHASEDDARKTLRSMKKWLKEGNTLPPVIKIYTHVTDYMVYKLSKFWSGSTSKLLSFEIGLYDSAKVPMNLYPLVPLMKLQFGPGTALPFINLSNHGILELEEEVVFVNDYGHYGKKRHTLSIGFVDFCYNFEERHLQFSLSNLHSVTCVNFSFADVYSDHLEELAVACPNLQRLNLKDVDNCLESLQGLRAIVEACQNLQGLNLAGISVSLVECYLLLWEVLSSAKKLTHLAVELCTLIPGDCDDDNEQKLIGMLRSCKSLQALEINCHDWGVICMECADEDASFAEDFLFSHFPSLLHVRLTLTDCTSALKYAVTSRHQLKYLCFENDFVNDVSLPLSMSCRLQQLCLQLQSTDLSCSFVDVLSAHGELERVVLLVKSVTTNAITTLIRNSPNLVLLYIVTKQPLCDEDGVRLKQKDYIDAMSKTFIRHKLFTTGSFDLLFNVPEVDKDEILGRLNTDLSSLWPSVHVHF